jgi:TIGR03009 family protein
MRAWMLGLAIVISAAAAQKPATKSAAKPATAQNTPAPKVDPQRLNDLLGGWEQKTKGMRDLECEFQRISRDRIFKTEVIDYGKASAIKPYRGRLDLMNEKGNPTQIFIYTGKKIHQYDFEKKEETIHILPDTEAGTGQSMPGPLGFVYGMSAAEAKARFDFKLISDSKGGGKYAEIHATPRTQIDQQEFKLAQLVIDKQTFLPKELRVIETNGNEQHWIFTRLETNLKPPVNPAELEPFDRTKIKELKNWKQVVNRFGEQAPGAETPKTKGASTSKTPTLKTQPEAGRSAPPKR